MRTTSVILLLFLGVVVFTKRNYPYPEDRSTEYTRCLMKEREKAKPHCTKEQLKFNAERIRYTDECEKEAEQQGSIKKVGSLYDIIRECVRQKEGKTIKRSETPTNKGKKRKKKKGKRKKKGKKGKKNKPKRKNKKNRRGRGN